MEISRSKSIFISLLFHIPLLIFIEKIILTPFALPLSNNSSIQLNGIKIDFELVKPKPPVKKNLPKELVETPDAQNLEKPPENAKFLSDKNAIARDKQKKKVIRDDMPYIRGENKDSRNFVSSGKNITALKRNEKSSILKEISRKDDANEKTSAPLSASNRIKKQEKLFADIRKRSRNNDRAKQFNKYLNETFKDIIKKRQGMNKSPESVHNNENSSAESVGDFGLSTYEWNWAPYVFQLKELIRSNWYVPPSYVKAGIANSGKTILRVTINRDGTFKEIRVVDYVGHQALTGVSVKILKKSQAPPLPKDFPDRNLKMTIEMKYKRPRGI